MPTPSPELPNCPDDDEILALVRGEELEGEDYARLVDHLSSCPSCPSRLEKLVGAAVEVPSTDTLSAIDRETETIVNRIKSRRKDQRSSHRQIVEFLDPLPDSEEGLGRIGKYILQSIAGEGGMGVVYRAEDTELHRTVAIKVLSPVLAVDEAARERFLREARSAAGTEHENVLPIHDMGRIEEHGLPYLVLPLVEGETLGDRIDRVGPLPIDEVVDLGKRIAAGLGAAHAKGLVHRDMKPANILLEEESGRLFIADFGLARAVEDQAGLTGTGLLMGTPQFMSPEQAGGGAIDHRSDWFSFGGILYAMATGKCPFTADSVLSTMRKVADEDPEPVPKLRPDCPGWLKRLIVRLMEKDPDKRLTETTSILESFQHEKPPPVKRRFGKAIAISVLVAVVAVVAGLTFPTFFPDSEIKSRPPSAPISLDRFRIGDQAYRTLAEAIRDAESGATVEVLGNTSIEIPPLTVTGKVLTLQARQGDAPEFSITSTEVPFFQTDSDLTLLGLSFRQETLGAHVPLLDLSGGKTEITNCRFVRGVTESGPAIITAEQPAEFRFLNSTIFAPGSIGIGLRRPRGEITVENSIIWSRRGMRTIFTDGRKPAEITVARCIWRTGETAFEYLGLTANASATQATSGNTFATEGDFLAVSDSDKDFATRLSWTSQQDRWGILGDWMRNDENDVHLSGPIDWVLYFGGDPSSLREVAPDLFSWLTEFREAPWELEPVRFRPEGFPAGKAQPSSRRPGIYFEWVGPGEAYRKWSAAQHDD